MVAENRQVRRHCCLYAFYVFLLIGWVALLHWRQGQSIAAAAAGVIFILAVFLCVVLHEFGHALTARRYGIKTRDIILLPIGGVARLGRLQPTCCRSYGLRWQDRP